MRLTRVEVDGVGRFGTPARIEGLGPGVNILAAGNEAGKSTFFRAIRTCLFERHGTKNSDVVALATDGLSLPVTVTLGFEHDNRSYEITKSFLKSPSASLRRDGVEMARNREADEAVWELLGITPSGGKSVDEAAYGILWVSQGHSFHMPQPTDAAASALNTAIQQEVGTLVGGERAQKVLAALNVSLVKILTESGKPKKGSALAEAERRVESITIDLRAAEIRLKEMDASLEELATLRAGHKQLTNPVETARLKQEMNEATQTLRSGEEAAKRLAQYEDDERRAQALLLAQETQLLALRERGKRIDDNHRRYNELLGEMAPLGDQEIEARSVLGENLTKVNEIDHEATTLEVQDRAAQRLLKLQQKVSERDGLAARLASLQSYEKHFTLNAAALRANGADEAAIAALDAIDQDAAVLTAKLEAAAAQLSVENHGTIPVTVNGKPITAGIVRAVTEPMSVAVGDMVKITVIPPENNIVAARSQREELRRRLQSLLDNHGAGTAAELRKMRQARMQLEHELRDLKGERTALGVKETIAAAEIARLAGEISRIDAECAQTIAEKSLTVLPSLEEIGRTQDMIAEKRTQLRAARSLCDSMISAQKDIIGRIGNRRGNVEGQIKEIKGQLDDDRAALPQDRRHVIIETSEREYAESAARHRKIALELSQERHGAPAPQELERRRNRVARLDVAIKNRTEQIESLVLRIANLEGQIQSSGGDGLGERVADLRAQQEMVEIDFARQTTRMQTLQILRDTVKQCYEKRREQLHAPLRRHLKPFLHDVFPQAEIELGEGFAVAGLHRAGPGSEAFERLSAGTQEQIAVLVRLAMGAMICERGGEVPVILDDALVFSDDTRIEQMFDAIDRAGKNQQVIVLTCRARSFATLGGNQIRIAS